MTVKGAGRGKHTQKFRQPRHDTFSFEYSPRHSVKTTQQHHFTIQQQINIQQQDIYVTAIIKMERPKQNYKSTEIGVRDRGENIRALRTATNKSHDTQ